MLSIAQGLALTRIGFGIYFIFSALNKTTGGWLNDSGPLVQSVSRAAPGSEGFYRPFLEGVVLPNASLFAQLVVLGEWFAGLSLALGLFTRAGALVGLLLVANYMLMKGLGNSMGSNDRLFAIACLAFALAPAGLAWALDSALGSALARIPLVNLLIGVPPAAAGWRGVTAPAR
jgi:uncharacterized membrane protein YphA (DoxX/SURF4 family)